MYVKGQPFSFKFDEIMTSQVKKKYDAYVQYYSKVLKLITTSLCGSLFVGHFSAENMLELFLEFISRLDLSLPCTIIKVIVGIVEQWKIFLWMLFEIFAWIKKILIRKLKTLYSINEFENV